MTNYRPRWPLVLCLLCAGGFLALTFWAASGRYLPGEQDLLRGIVLHRVSIFNSVALLISALGSVNLTLPFWIALVTVFSLERQATIVLRLFPVPLAYPLYTLIKSWVGRPGPKPAEYPWLYDLPLGYYLEGLLRRRLEELPSQGIVVPVAQQPVTAQAVTQVMESGYISGHALVAVIFYGILAWCLWTRVSGGRMRWVVVVPVALLAILVGVVRVYMAIHFPSDVLGAWLLGIVCLILVDRGADVVCWSVVPRWRAWRAKRMALG